MVLFLFKFPSLFLNPDEYDDKGKFSIIIELFWLILFLKGFILFIFPLFGEWKLNEDFEGLKWFKELLNSFGNGFLQ